MTKRKQTPDVLAEILGGSLDLPDAGRPTPALKPAAPERVQWEVAVVSFQEYKGWRPRYINGRELKDWTAGPLIHDYIAEMGEDGWEIAAASAGERLYGSADNHHIYFKRPNV
jgi:hypothetical protein